MNYAEAMHELTKDNEWAVGSDGDDAPNLSIAKEVGGALAEGFRDRVDFGTFDNCREWGLTFTVADWTFCCYEHRNSDMIHAEGCPTSEVAPYGPYGGADKWDTMFSASWQQYPVVIKALSAAILAVEKGITSRELLMQLMRSTAEEAA